MTDIISKIIGVILAFLLLVFAPLTMTELANDSAMKRLVLNETETFIDRVTDKRGITKSDIDDLMLGVNAHGGVFDVAVVTYEREVQNVFGELRSVYMPISDGVCTLNGGDTVKVTITQIGSTRGQSAVKYVTKAFLKPFSFSLAGIVK